MFRLGGCVEGLPRGFSHVVETCVVKVAAVLKKKAKRVAWQWDLTSVQPAA